MNDRQLIVLQCLCNLDCKIESNLAFNELLQSTAEPSTPIDPIRVLTPA